MAEPVNEEFFEATLPQWQLLSAEEQGAYANAHRLERARALLGFSALVNDVYTDQPPNDVDTLRTQLLELPLSEVTEIASTIEKLGRQLGTSLFRADSVVERPPRLFVLPDTSTPKAEVSQVATPAPSSPAGLAEAVPAPSQTILQLTELINTSVAPEEAPEPLTKQHASFLRSIYGKDVVSVISGLTYEAAERAVEWLGAMYEARKRGYHSTSAEQLRRLQQYVHGVSQEEIAATAGVSAGAIELGRRSIIKVLKREYTQEELLGVLADAITGRPEAIEQQSPDPDLEPAEPAAVIPAPRVSAATLRVSHTTPLSEPAARAETITAPEASGTALTPDQVLVQKIHEFTDAQGMGPRERRALIQRLNPDTVVPLTDDCVSALRYVSAQYAKCQQQGIIFDKLERKVMQLLLAEGVNQGQKPLPAQYVKQHLLNTLHEEQRDITDCFINIFGKLVIKDKEASASGNPR